MLKVIMPLLCSLVLSVALAEVKRKGHVHQHGKGSFSIAIQGTQGKLELKSPIDSIVGFEHKPKKPKDVAIYDKAMTKLSSEISKMVIFDPTLNCEIKKDLFETSQESSGNHSDIVVDYNVICGKSPEGTTMNLDFSKTFPRLKEVEISILVGVLQKSAAYTGSPLAVELK